MPGWINCVVVWPEGNDETWTPKSRTGRGTGDSQIGLMNLSVRKSQPSHTWGFLPEIDHHGRNPDLPLAREWIGAISLTSTPQSRHLDFRIHCFH